MQTNLSIEELLKMAQVRSGARSMGDLCKKIGASRNCGYNWKAGGRPNLEHTMKLGAAIGLSAGESLAIWTRWKADAPSRK